MSIKDLFGNAYKSFASASADVESTEFVKNKAEEQEVFLPPVDFASASNFVKYGLAELYYKNSISRVYNDYPYDGSKSEQIEFQLSSSYLDRWVFKKYPKTTGFINLGTTANYSTPMVDGYAPTSTPEFIRTWGGIHTASAGMEGKPLYTTFDKSMKYDSVLNRTQNWRIDPNSGSTVEFWMKKDAFDTSNTEREVILDLWNGELTSSSKYGRLTIELDTSGGPVFLATLQSGSDGVFRAPACDPSLTYTSLSLRDWHHYAISLKRAAPMSGVQIDFYVDGMEHSSSVSGSSVNEVKGLVNGYIGALQTGPNHSDARFHNKSMGGSGKFSGSLDEFRYWKKKRTGQEIELNWFRQVGGGTNTDDKTSNINLGVYYKFNEGIVGSSSIDQNVLDYSGRIANGWWQGYVQPGRSTGSAINSYSSELSESATPIIYESHPYVRSFISEMETSGSEYDRRTGNSLYYSLPSWIVENDESSNQDLKKVTQIISSYFDTLHAQITALTNLKNKGYVTPDYTPLPFSDELLKEKGMITPDLFINSEVLEYFDNVDKNAVDFDDSITNLKNLIYVNIYNNLESIYKSKGTERSIRNLIRCFGIDDELVKLNMYTDNGTHYLTDKSKPSSISTKYINFNNPDYFSSTITQVSSSNNHYSYISGSTTQTVGDNGAFTLEADIIVPYKKEKNQSGWFDTPFLTSSVFGFHQAKEQFDLTIPGGGWDYGWLSLSDDVANLSVYLARDKLNSRNAKFVVKNRDNSIFLTSSYINNIYDNNHWNVAVRIKPDNYPYTGMSASSPTYELNFYAVQTNFDSIENEIILTASLDNTLGSKYLRFPKRVYAGAELINFTGSTANYKSDMQIGSVRAWYDYINNEAIQQHNRDGSNFGISKAVRESNIFLIPDVKIPSQDLTILNWDFDTVSSSNNAGTFLSEDITRWDAGCNSTAPSGTFNAHGLLVAGYGSSFNAGLTPDRLYLSSSTNTIRDFSTVHNISGGMDSYYISTWLKVNQDSNSPQSNLLTQPSPILYLSHQEIIGWSTSPGFGFHSLGVSDKNPVSPFGSVTAGKYRLTFQVKDQDGGTQQKTFFTPEIDCDEWVHIALFCDTETPMSSSQVIDDGRVTIFINNVSASLVELPNPTSPNTNSPYRGINQVRVNKDGRNNQHVNYNLDELAIFTGSTAIMSDRPTKAAELYNNGNWINFAGHPECYAWYRFGDEAGDDVTQGNHVNNAANVGRGDLVSYHNSPTNTANPFSLTQSSFTVTSSESVICDPSTNRYSWADNIIRRQYNGQGYHFGSNKTSFVENEYIYAEKKEFPEISFTSDNIAIETDKRKYFIEDEDVSDNFYLLEKSLNQVVSEEMIKLFSSVQEFSNLFGRNVDKFRIDYKDLEKARDHFFERVEDDPDLDRFLDYYKWIDSSLSEMIAQLIPATANFGPSVVDVVDSHILERNKYQRRIGLLTTVESTEGGLRGISEMTYNWREGHAPLGITEYDATPNENCLWGKERRERNFPPTSTSVDREEIRKVAVYNQIYRKDGPTILHTIDKTPYTGSEYYNRALTKTYLIKPSIHRQIHGGINYGIQKDREFFRTTINPHGTVGASGAPNNVLGVGIGVGQGIVPETKCLDSELPNSKKFFEATVVVGKFSTLGNTLPKEADLSYVHRLKASRFWPFNILSASVENQIKSGYNKQVYDGFRNDAVLVNLHSDTVDLTNEIPMQGPFTSQHVGGAQNRHVGINRYDRSLTSYDGSPTINNLDGEYSRPEAWRLLIGENPLNPSPDGAMGLVGPDYGGPYPDATRQWAIYYRGNRAKRPVNIANILSTTGSKTLGNYQHSYQVFNSSYQKYLFRRLPDGANLLPEAISKNFPKTTNYMTLLSHIAGEEGNVFGTHPNNRQPDQQIQAGPLSVVSALASGSFVVDIASAQPVSYETFIYRFARPTPVPAGEKEIYAFYFNSTASVNMAQVYENSSEVGWEVQIDTAHASLTDNWSDTLLVNWRDKVNSTHAANFPFTISNISTTITIAEKDRYDDGNGGSFTVSDPSLWTSNDGGFSGGYYITNYPLSGTNVTIRDPYADLTSSASDRFIKSVFSAPGGPEVNSQGFLDVESRQYSVYNNLNYRNLSVRSSGSGEIGSIHVVSDDGSRAGLASLLPRRMGKFGLTSTDNITSLDISQTRLSASQFKQHRNTQQVPYLTGDRQQVVSIQNDGGFEEEFPGQNGGMFETVSYKNNFPRKGGISVSFWINPIDRYGSILFVKLVALAHTTRLFIDNSDNLWWISWGGTHGNHVLPGLRQRAKWPNISTVIPTHTWTYCTLTWTQDKSNIYSLYINGLSSSITPTIDSYGIDDRFELFTPKSIRLASPGELAAYGYGPSLTGSLSEFSIWNTALNAKDVADLYNENGYALGQTKTPFLRDYWRLGKEISNFSSGSALLSGTVIPSMIEANDLRASGFFSGAAGPYSEDVIKERKKYDNMYINSSIPRSDFQYSWINNAISGNVNWESKQPIRGYAPNDGIVYSPAFCKQYPFTEAIKFPVISDIICCPETLVNQPVIQVRAYPDESVYYPWKDADKVEYNVTNIAPVDTSEIRNSRIDKFQWRVMSQSVCCDDDALPNQYGLVTWNANHATASLTFGDGETVSGSYLELIDCNGTTARFSVDPNINSGLFQGYNYITESGVASNRITVPMQGIGTALGYASQFGSAILGAYNNGKIDILTMNNGSTALKLIQGTAGVCGNTTVSKTVLQITAHTNFTGGYSYEPASPTATTQYGTQTTSGWLAATASIPQSLAHEPHEDGRLGTFRTALARFYTKDCEGKEDKLLVTFKEGRWYT